MMFNCLIAFSQTPDFSLVGYGNATTGGQDGNVVRAYNYSQLKTFAESTATYIIEVSGMIENGADGGSIRVKSNKTIIGIGETAYLHGVGLNITGYNNIIIRNLRISMIGVTTRVDKAGVYSSTGDEGRPQILTNGGDCIGIRAGAYNVWVDHCKLFSEDPSVQTNIDLYDGIIDMTQDCHNITLSWNYIHNHHKTHLVGSSEEDLSDRKITFHHNYYYKCKDRLPLYRAGTAHFFNNYLLDCPNGVNTRINACVYVESNHFENVTSNTIYSKSSTISGYATLVDNLFINSKAPSAGTCNSFVPSTIYDYSHVLHPKEAVKNIVTNWAGVGKLDIKSGTGLVKLNSSVYKIDNALHVRTYINSPELELFALSGILQKKTTGKSLQISEMKCGVYLLNIRDTDYSMETHKIIL